MRYIIILRSFIIFTLVSLLLSCVSYNIEYDGFIVLKEHFGRRKYLIDINKKNKYKINKMININSDEIEDAIIINSSYIVFFIKSDSLISYHLKNKKYTAIKIPNDFNFYSNFKYLSDNYYIIKTNNNINIYNVYNTPISPQKFINSNLTKYDFYNMYLQDNYIYYTLADSVFRNNVLDKNNEFVREESKEFVSYVKSTKYLLRMETIDNRNILTIFDGNTNDVLERLNLGNQFVSLYQHEGYFITTINKDIFLMRERDRLFSAGGGDWFQLDLSNFSMKRIKSISEDMFSHRICGFIDKKYLNIFEYQELKSE